MLPFHATESEKRIIRDLLATAELRNEHALKDAEVWRERGIDTADKLILFLKRKLFPQETSLIEERTRLLAPLQSGTLRVHFDQSLETATLTINGKIRTEEEYRRFIDRLQGFDFARWLRHCEGERSDAD